MLVIKGHLERISTTQEDSVNSITKIPSHRRALNANSNQIMKTDSVAHLHEENKAIPERFLKFEKRREGK